MRAEFWTVVFGLASAMSWGAGDFSGGLASRRSPASMVVWLSQMVGMGLLFLLALGRGEPFPTAYDLLMGVLAGIAGVIGLALLYRGLASGQMGVVAPLTAVVSFAIPVLFTALVEGIPPIVQLAGFGFALLAVWLLARPPKGSQFMAKDLLLPLVSGTAFALFFILIDQVQTGAVFWPLVASRVASISMLFGVLRLRGPLVLPNGRLLPLIALSGICDAGGNAFFVLATQAGRLDIAAVLSSLYPATTVLLAGLVLHERLIRQQWLGVIAALIALALIAA